MKKKNNVKGLVGIASLSSLVVILQLMSNYIQIGTVSITLALIPLVMGAIIYGPGVGFFLGALMGALIITAPSTSLFLGFNVWATIILCILKTGLAGAIVGFAYKGIIRLKFLKQYKFPVAIIVSSLLAPIINTSIFIFGTAIMFQGLSIDGNILVPSTGGFGEAFTAAVGFVVLTNFVIEFCVEVILSPSLVYLAKILGNKFDLGFSKDFKNEINKNEK